MSEEIELEEDDETLLGYDVDELEWMEANLMDYGIDADKDEIARILWMAERNGLVLGANQEEMC